MLEEQVSIPCLILYSEVTIDRNANACTYKKSATSAYSLFIPKHKIKCICTHLSAYRKAFNYFAASLKSCCVSKMLFAGGKMLLVSPFSRYSSSHNDNTAHTAWWLTITYTEKNGYHRSTTSPWLLHHYQASYQGYHEVTPGTPLVSVTMLELYPWYLGSSD